MKARDAVAVESNSWKLNFTRKFSRPYLMEISTLVISFGRLYVLPARSYAHALRDYWRDISDDIALNLAGLPNNNVIKRKFDGSFVNVIGELKDEYLGIHAHTRLGMPLVKESERGSVR
jgi:hypothetical protein